MFLPETNAFQIYLLDDLFSLKVDESKEIEEVTALDRIVKQVQLEGKLTRRGLKIKTTELNEPI